MSTRFRLPRVVAAVAAGLALLAASGASAGPLTGVKQLRDAAGSIAGSRVIEVAGCHANAQYHMVHKWGYPAMHRHGPACNPHPVVAGPPVHCHRSFQKHHHFGHGTKWHRHGGPGCNWTKGVVGGGPGVGCIKIGAIWICS